MTLTAIEEIQTILSIANKCTTFTGCWTFLVYEADKANNIV